MSTNRLVGMCGELYISDNIFSPSGKIASCILVMKDILCVVYEIVGGITDAR